jgi:acetylornithine deacetylase/succinyl-diaminopimelate desuccinylase family protein
MKAFSRGDGGEGNVQVAEMIEKSVVTDLLRNLIKIPSLNPPGEETAVAKYIVEWSRDRGLAAELREAAPGRSNAIVTVEGKGGRRDGPTLLFNGHMDVVQVGQGWTFDPFGGEVKGDLVYGRGACDMKAGLAAMLASAKAIADSGVEFTGKLIIACVVDEEGPGVGTQHLLKNGITADYAVIGEPTSLVVVTASKGDVTFEIKTSGKAAHSSRPEEGVNAITKMRRIMDGIDKYSKMVGTKTHPILGHPTVSIDLIEGGVSPWIIPESCRIVVDRRMVPGETFGRVKTELATLVEELQDQDKEVKLELSYIQADEPVEISRSEQIVKTLVEAATGILGRNAEVGGLSGTTDARFIVNQAKIPTVIFGPGSLSQAHKPNEYVSANETHLAAKIYATAALQLLALEAGRFR